MASIASVVDFREYLEQVPAGAPIDAKIQKVLNRATATCYRAMELVAPWTWDGYTTGDQVVQSWGTPTLFLPPHQAASITTVVFDDGSTVGLPVAGTDYVEQADGTLYRRTVMLLSPGSGWARGRYTIHAGWGLGTTPPDDLVEVCLEVAVNIWRSKDKGLWTDVIGVEGSGGLRFIGGLTTQQKGTLAAIREQYAQNVPALAIVV